MKALMTLEEAADETPYGVRTLRKAIHAVEAYDADGEPVFPPPLKAKRGSRGAFNVRAVDLQAWIDALPDA